MMNHRMLVAGMCAALLLFAQSFALAQRKAGRALAPDACDARCPDGNADCRKQCYADKKAKTLNASDAQKESIERDERQRVREATEADRRASIQREADRARTAHERNSAAINSAAEAASGALQRGHAAREAARSEQESRREEQEERRNASKIRAEERADQKRQQERTEAEDESRRRRQNMSDGQERDRLMVEEQQRKVAEERSARARVQVEAPPSAPSASVAAKDRRSKKGALPPAAPPPSPETTGPSLTETLAWITEKSLESGWSTKVKNDEPPVKVEVRFKPISGCKAMITRGTEGVVLEEVHVDLADTYSVTLHTFPNRSCANLQGYTTWRVTWPRAGVRRETEELGVDLCFASPEMATRVEKALSRAVDLCRNVKSAEPF